MSDKAYTHPDLDLMDKLLAGYLDRLLPLGIYIEKNPRLSPARFAQVAAQVRQSASALYPMAAQLVRLSGHDEDQARWAGRLFRAIAAMTRMCEPRTYRHLEPLTAQELEVAAEFSQQSRLRREHQLQAHVSA